ncbi:adenylate kinase [Patescibacteria group bacterium]
MNILMLGVQGSGKGTQAKLLSQKTNLLHISSGDIFRSLDKTTKLGKEVAGVINKGHLVSDDLTIKLVQQRLEKEDCKNGVILDGFPRNLPQAKAMDKFLQLDYVIQLTISDKEAINRLSGRRTCSNKTCSAIYNIYTAPKPKQENICDQCSSSLYQRKDATEEAVKERLEIYHKETKPLVEYYKAEGILIEINGEQPIENVQAEIQRNLNV